MTEAAPRPRAKAPAELDHTAPLRIPPIPPPIPGVPPGAVTTTAAKPVVSAKPRSAPSGRIRLGYLDGVRALAASYVALHHTWLIAFQSFPHNVGPFWVAWLVYGHLAVAVFIVVSGFSLAIEPVRGDMQLSGGGRGFIRRRAWRILPTYWAALVFSCFALWITGQQALGYNGAVLGAEPVTMRGAVVHALLLQDVIGSKTPNGAFWSIAIEWQIYFLFPLLLWWRRRFGLTSTIVLTTIVVIAAYEVSFQVHALHGIQNLIPQFLALFAFGVAAAHMLREPRRINGRLLVAASGIGAVALVVYFNIVGAAVIVNHFFWADLGVGACAALLFAGLADPRRSVTRTILSSRPLRKVGRFSYSVYLVHAPILTLIWAFIVVRLHLPSKLAAFEVFVALAVPGVLIGSWLFSLLFEEPFVRNRSFAALRTAMATRLGRPTGRHA